LLVLDRKLHKEDRSVQVQLSLVGTTSLVSLLQERYICAFIRGITQTTPTTYVQDYCS